MAKNNNLKKPKKAVEIKKILKEELKKQQKEGKL